MAESLRVGIVGAAGYTGLELIRLVHQHPRLKLSWVAAQSNAGKTLGEVAPSLLGVQGVAELRLASFAPSDAAALKKDLDVVFCALPHGASSEAVAALYAAGLTVVDLSADFRLRDAGTYAKWYGPHHAEGLLGQAVYGQPELHRSELKGAKLIAAPGCYPTSAVLPLAPLLAAKLVESTGIIVDSKSGVSGAGRSPKPAYHFPESSEGIRPYNVAGAHRHTPEIEQELSRAAGSDVKVTFTPQLAPFTRGILSCAYARARPGTTADVCRAAAKDLYTSGLVTVLDAGLLPDTLWVRGSARAQIAYALDERTGLVLAFCVIDNLARGASAQAIQALNVSLGWEDALGLPVIAQFP
ncbi:MAG TPA: N-acetyl-gamma-glutamyl-phosphate reductase [Polyangiaceae bacterium]|nr:N-acetyl-gamma-glutamyl-phosphate reductase [Polyangiaceae bacterium]